MRKFSRECHFVHFFSTSGDSRANSPQAGESKGGSMFTKRLALAVGMIMPLAVVLGSAGFAAADTITTGTLANQTGTSSNDNSDLISVSSGYYAASFDTTSSSTVGGVTFTPFLSGSGSAASDGTGASGNITLTNFGHLYNQDFNHDGTTFTTGDTGLDTILDGGVYEDGTTKSVDNPPGEITFNNLTAGKTYQIQFFAVDNRKSSNGLSGRTFQVSNNSTFSNAGSGAYASPVVQYAFDSTGTVSTVGSYIDWTFTASGTTQTFYEQLGNNNPNSTQYNTFQGAQFNGVIITPAATPVPEPATVALFGLAAAAGMLLLRRRHPAH